MRQNGVAPRLPQRNELISPRFFVNHGKRTVIGGVAQLKDLRRVVLAIFDASVL